MKRTTIIAVIAALGFVTMAAAQGIPEALAERAGVMSFDAVPARSIAGAAGDDVVKAVAFPAGLASSVRKTHVNSATVLAPLTDSESSILTGSDAVMSHAEGGYRVGIERGLRQSVHLVWNGDAKSSALDDVGEYSVWTASFRSPGADGLRLRFNDAALPSGVRVFVYSTSGESYGPYTSDTISDASFWTNAVYSDEVFLEVQIPRAARAARLTVSAVGHLSFASPTAAAATACFYDASCATESDLRGVGNLSHAVAEILYEDGGSFYVCSGALVNTSMGNSVPYFLTANHCIPNQTQASTIEAYWDYRTSSCDGEAPPRSQSQRTLGATLLATGPRELGKPDFSLLQLSGTPPPGRYYLGWSTDDIVFDEGTSLYRVAHPNGATQSFSRHTVTAIPAPSACPGLPQGMFIYSRTKAGATTNGSSGSPAVVADGLRIVGQLYGRCGQNLSSECDTLGNSTVDGAFRLTYPYIARWLDPSGGAAPCVPGPTVLCLGENRFKVSLSARDQRTGTTAIGQAIPQNEIVGYFSLPALTMQPKNPEVFVKILDGRAITGKYWLFYGGLTDVGFTLTVTDTATASVRTYTKTPGSLCGGADTSAF
ncbi:MAG TPA: trypsin-like peptidase domain-containing protein [Thermoanaerobaculia bacterium]|nr:trypsin-like peptidase domain-containing protein [Thermoanaerobaculia bacterium]